MSELNSMKIREKRDLKPENILSCEIKAETASRSQIGSLWYFNGHRRAKFGDVGDINDIGRRRVLNIVSFGWYRVCIQHKFRNIYTFRSSKKWNGRQREKRLEGTDESKDSRPNQKNQAVKSEDEE